MSGYGPPSGSFSLKDSNTHVGSFIQKCDVATLLDGEFREYKDAVLSGITFQKDDSADEQVVAHCWKTLVPSEIRRKRSFDEIVLVHLIRRAYPEAELTMQAPFGKSRGNRPQVDFIIKVNGVAKAVEFMGPGHFIGSYAEKPSIRQEKVKAAIGIECVAWPFWIQRCERNVKAMFEAKYQGLGSFWSCSKSCLFGKFPFDNAADIVEELNGQFRAARNGSCGYFYERNSEGRVKPEHFILDQIRKGICKTNVMIPSGVQPSDYWKWLPIEFVS